jgi:hypothetical protein
MHHSLDEHWYQENGRPDCPSDGLELTSCELRSEDDPDFGQPNAVVGGVDEVNEGGHAPAEEGVAVPAGKKTKARAKKTAVAAVVAENPMVGATGENDNVSATVVAKNVRKTRVPAKKAAQATK